VLTHGAVALVALVLGVGIGSSGGSSGGNKSAATAASPQATAAVTSTAPADAAPADTATTRPATTAAKPKPKATTKPGPATSFDGDGEYLVGEDIAAGTYKTAGPQDDFSCYWERDKDSSGSFESIIANDNLSGTGRVTVEKGEVFKTQGCRTWQKVG
jgi:hypothetical protein